MANQNVKKWTEGAVYCYKRGCNCTGCYIKEILESRCRMKCTVINLVKEFGRPITGNKFTKAQQIVINAILAGCNDKYEIAKYTKFSPVWVQSILTKMYSLAEADGIEYKNLRYKLPDFINWVRKGE